MFLSSMIPWWTVAFCICLDHTSIFVAKLITQKELAKTSIQFMFQNWNFLIALYLGNYLSNIFLPIVKVSNPPSFFSPFYLKGTHTDRNCPATESLPKCPNQPGLGQSDASSPEFNPSHQMTEKHLRLSLAISQGTHLELGLKPLTPITTSSKAYSISNFT